VRAFRGPLEEAAGLLVVEQLLVAGLADDVAVGGEGVGGVVEAPADAVGQVEAGPAGHAELPGALAPTPWLLLAARVAQGMGAAMAAPTALALITGSFEEGTERDRAAGLYSAMGALGSITGVVLGGVVTELLGWRWAMVAALPIALPALLSPRRSWTSSAPRTGPGASTSWAP
jgi:MFS family permease